MIHSIVSITIASLVAGAPLCAHAANIAVEGDVSAGMEVEELKNGQTAFAVHLRFSTDPSEDVRGVVAIGADAQDQAVRLAEALIVREANGMRESLGLDKRRFGFEGTYDDSERLTLKKTLLHRKLEAIAYTGKELAAALHNGDYDISLGYADTQKMSVICHYGGGGDGTLNHWLLLQADRVNERQQTVGAYLAGVNHSSGRDQVEFEVALGVDPVETAFYREYGNGRTVVFSGIKSVYRHGLDAFEGRLIPLVAASVVGHDVKDTRYNSFALTLGTTYMFSEKLSLAAEVEGVAANSKAELSRRSYDQSFALFLARYIL